jgi:hypothetical protein
MTDTASSLARKVRRLEAKLAESDAERDLYQMMAHDLASERLIEIIEKRYPTIAAKWRVPA